MSALTPARPDLDSSQLRPGLPLFHPPCPTPDLKAIAPPLSEQGQVHSTQSPHIMDDAEQPPSPSSATKPRIPYACEACRAAKVKCTPSNTSDICRR